MHICNIFCNFAPELWYYIAMKAQIINKQTHKQMKKILYVLALGCVLMGCRSKLDLGNMDTKTQVQMGMALPVGSIRMYLKDILGDVDGLYIDTVDGSPVLAWKMDTTISRDYHEMNLAKYLSAVDVDLNVYDKLSAYSINIGGIDYSITSPLITTIPFPIDLPVELEYPFDLPLTGINSKDYIYERERLDIAQIDSAKFRSVINTTDFPFNWEWVDDISLDLGPRFDRPAGNLVSIYKKGDTKVKKYGDTIPILIDNFALDMMKKHFPATSEYAQFFPGNVYDTCAFKIKFKFTIPQGTTLASNITSSSKIDYHLDVKFLDFSSIKGMFEPSKDMYDESVIDLDKSLGKLDFLTKALIPISRPQIDVRIVTAIAGALFIDDAYVYIIEKDDPTKTKKYAEFGISPYIDVDDGIRIQHKQFMFEKGEWLDPETAALTDTTNLLLNFNRSPKGGRLHELFRKMPKELGYQFFIKFNSGITPQLRITPNTFINVHSVCKIPFMFDQGIKVNYPDTAYNINLSKLSLDSLEKESNVIDTLNATNLKLVLIAQNSIPMHVKVSMRCFDKNDQPIMDPKDPSKPFILFEKDTIELEPPTYTKLSNSQIVPTSDGKTTIISNLDKDELNTLPKINKIVYSAILDDESLQYAYKMGLVNVRLTEDQYVTMKIGVAGNIDAVLNFEKNNK